MFTKLITRSRQTKVLALALALALLFSVGGMSVFARIDGTASASINPGSQSTYNCPNSSAIWTGSWGGAAPIAITFDVNDGSGDGFDGSGLNPGSYRFTHSFTRTGVFKQSFVVIDSSPSSAKAYANTTVTHPPQCPTQPQQ